MAEATKTKKRAAPAGETTRRKKTKDADVPAPDAEVNEAHDDVKVADDDVEPPAETDAAAEPDMSPNVADLIDAFVKTRQEHQAVLKNELDLLRNIKKVYKKEVRLLAKSKSKKTRKGIKRKKSGIATISYMSPQLCAFLGEPEGTLLPRTIATKRIIKYVQEANLCGREGILKKNGTPNRQFITPNDELKALIGDPDGLNFFSIQTALNPHFKNVPA